MDGLVLVSRLDPLISITPDNVSGIVILLNKVLSEAGIKFLFGSSLYDIVSGFGLPVSCTKILW